MALKRVIPCLDVDAGRVVKGTNFVGLRDAGAPVELAERYDAAGADELVFLDITSSHQRPGAIVARARRAPTPPLASKPPPAGGAVRAARRSPAAPPTTSSSPSPSAAGSARS